MENNDLWVNYTGYKCPRCNKKIYGELAMGPWNGVIYCKPCKREVIKSEMQEKAA